MRSNDLLAASYEQDRNERRIAAWHAKGGPRLRQAEIEVQTDSEFRRDHYLMPQLIAQAEEERLERMRQAGW